MTPTRVACSTLLTVRASRLGITLSNGCLGPKLRPLIGANRPLHTNCYTYERLDNPQVSGGPSPISP